LNSVWLPITSLLDENIRSKKFTNPEIQSPMHKSVIPDKTGFDYSVAILKEILFHGTSEKLVESILVSGLDKRSR